MRRRPEREEMVGRDLWGLLERRVFFFRKIPFLKGIMMDHLPFGRVGIPALSLTSVSKEGWHLHTQRDRFSLLDRRGLEEMGKFLLATAQWLETGRQK